MQLMKRENPNTTRAARYAVVSLASILAMACEADEPATNEPTPTSIEATATQELGGAKSPRSPVRLVTLGGAVTEIVAALGHGDEIVGVDISSTYPASLEKLPRVGYYRKVSAEGVLSLAPTKILATTNLGPPPAVKQIVASGIEMVMIPSAKTPEEAVTRIEVLGRVLGEEAKAKELSQKLEGSLARAKARGEAASTEGKCALFIYARGANHLMVSGKNSAADTMLSLAGFPNCIKDFDGFKPLTAEAVIAAKPTHILIPEKGAASIGGVDGVVELAGVGQTPAGADKRVVLVDDLTLLGFGPRMGEALEAMQDGLGIPDKDADIEAKK